MRLIGRLLVFTRIFPRFPKPGDTMRQALFTWIGLQEPADLAVLVRYWSNQVRQEGIEQVFCLCERGDPLLGSLKGFIHIDSARNTRGSHLGSGYPVISRISSYRGLSRP